MKFYSKGFSGSDSKPEEGKIQDKPKAVKKCLPFATLNTESTLTIKPSLFQVGKINEFAVDFSCIIEGKRMIGSAQQISLSTEDWFPHCIRISISFLTDDAIH